CGRNPASVSSSVDLPLPLGPVSAIHSPDAIPAEASSRMAPRPGTGIRSPRRENPDDAGNDGDGDGDGVAATGAAATSGRPSNKPSISATAARALARSW